MSKPILYRVEIEIDMYVIAETEGKAKQAAMQNISEEAMHGDYMISPAKNAPRDWLGSCPYPYPCANKYPEQTCEEWLREIE